MALMITYSIVARIISTIVDIDIATITFPARITATSKFIDAVNARSIFTWIGSTFINVVFTINTFPSFSANTAISRLSQTDKFFWLSGLDVSQKSAECRYDLKKETEQKRCSTYFGRSIFVTEICFGLKAYFSQLLIFFRKNLGSERIQILKQFRIFSDPKLLQKKVNKCKKSALNPEPITVTKIEPAKYVEHLF